MHVVLYVPPIVFFDNDLPSIEVQNQYDSLMVVVSFHQNIICLTLIDNESGLNVCSIDMIKEIKVDLTIIHPDNFPIHGFENFIKITFGIIT